MQPLLTAISTSALMAAARIPEDPPSAPWPDVVQAQFKNPALLEPWVRIPEDLNRREAMLRYFRGSHKGRPVYPASVAQFRDWESDWWAYHNYGRRLATYDDSNDHPLLQWLKVRLQPSEASLCDVSPEQLAFSRIALEAARPGDLVSYRHAFGWHAGIVTQLNYQNEVCEVLLFHGLALYLSHPANGGQSPRFWRYQAQRRSKVVETEPLFETAMFEKRSEDWDQVAALIDTINFRSAAFAILRRHYYGGMLKGVFEAHLRFANLEEVLLHVSTQPVNRVKSLHVTIRYLGSSEDGHRLFPIHAERALRHVARRGGFRQLNIYHALVLKDPQIEALERGGYGRRQSPEGMQRWAKRIEL